MRELVTFSLRRRFLNKAQITLNIIMFVVIGCVFFADGIIDLVNPDLLDAPILYLKNMDHYTQDKLIHGKQEGFSFKVWKKQKVESTKQYILEFDNGYKIHSQYPMDEMSVQSISGLLTSIHQLAIQEESGKDNPILMEYSSNLKVVNKVKEKDFDVSSEKQKLVFMVITGIYFMMLSFASSAATEVVYEKSTKTLELILTSVSANVHFLSKMIVGWLVIMFQCIFTLSYVFFWFVLRNIKDEGLGLLAAVDKLKMFPIKGKTFHMVLSNINLEADFVINIITIFLFLFVGILFIQLILVVLSSFISNMEEAGNVQGPFYLILLGVYYLTLSLNTPYQMQEGLGFILSFLPFFSMLFMPCRLLLCEIGWSEILLSFTIAVSAVVIVIKMGGPLYQKGVLDYSNKGLFNILKSIKKMSKK
ncbi:MAG: ABC transporter permease, partial [Erysipelotrichaceae bacterium]